MLQRAHLFLADQIGESDCEDIDDGILAQPVNALSSLAYTLFGIWLIIRALRNRTNEMAIEILYGVALAAVGLGSVAFHGPMPPGARFVHDWTIAVVLAVILGRNLGAILEWMTTAVVWAIVGISAVVAVVMVIAPDAGNTLTGVVGLGAVATEAMLYRQGRRRFSRRVAWFLGTVVLLLIAAAILNLLGRTGGPICDPDSLFQAHAVWHALTAASFMLYGYAAFPAAPIEASEASTG